MRYCCSRVRFGSSVHPRMEYTELLSFLKAQKYVWHVVNCSTASFFHSSSHRLYHLCKMHLNFILSNTPKFLQVVFSPGGFHSTLYASHVSPAYFIIFMFVIIMMLCLRSVVFCSCWIPFYITPLRFSGLIHLPLIAAISNKLHTNHIRPAALLILIWRTIK